MNKKKIITFVTFSFLLITVLLSIPLVLCQEEWDYCTIYAYGTFVEEPGEYGFTFTTAEPPAGSEIPNTLYVIRYSSGENYTNNLSVGDKIQVSTLDVAPDTMDFTSGSEANHFIITYEGEARYVRLNNINIPEFSSVLLVPIFIAVTLLALIYRRKR